MTPAVKVGQRVRVPWGLTTLVGTVVDVYADGQYASVEVPVGGSSGEVLETSRVSLRVDALHEVRPWRVVKTRSGHPAAGADADMSWYVDLERDGERRRVEVRVAGGLAERREHGRQVPADIEQAFRTNGRSAVEPYVEEEEPPRVLVAGSFGVSPLRQ